MEFRETEVWGFDHALRGMRNPMNSWDKSDSKYTKYVSSNGFEIGKNDLRLAQSLINAGSEHCKFMRMIHVAVDVDMPRYFWSEMDTYSFNTKNSCSTMHRLLNNNEEISLDQFEWCEEDKDLWNDVIKKLESLRNAYKFIQSTTKDSELMNSLLVRAKRILPEGFLQTRTFDTNYAELRNIYFQRRNHKLKEEWGEFCKWVESLPYAKELIMYEGESDEQN